jgi:hypothetical protein
VHVVGFYSILWTFECFKRSKDGRESTTTITTTDSTTTTATANATTTTAATTTAAAANADSQHNQYDKYQLLWIQY